MEVNLAMMHTALFIFNRIEHWREHNTGRCDDLQLCHRAIIKMGKPVQ